MSATLTIEITPGASIDSAAKSAQRVANLLRLQCKFAFNDVTCYAVPDGDEALLAERQQAEQSRKLNSPFDHRCATSRRAEQSA